MSPPVLVSSLGRISADSQRLLWPPATYRGAVSRGLTTSAAMTVLVSAASVARLDLARCSGGCSASIQSSASTRSLVGDPSAGRLDSDRPSRPTQKKVSNSLREAFSLRRRRGVSRTARSPSLSSKASLSESRSVAMTCAPSCDRIIERKPVPAPSSRIVPHVAKSRSSLSGWVRI